jgi:hypothetical protein
MPVSDAPAGPDVEPAETGSPEAAAGCALLCPVSFFCDPTLGCTAGAYANGQGTLYATELPSGLTRSVGSTSFNGTPVDLFDIALAPDGTLYGIDPVSVLYTIEPSTGDLTAFHLNNDANLNALDAAPDGTLYAAAATEVFTIDLSTHTLKPFASYPTGLASSGDLAILGGQLFATVSNGQPMSNDVLLVMDLATRTTTVLGSTGFPCVYGLAAQGMSLFGFTCNGQVLRLDTTSGQGTLLATPGQVFFGASSR